MASSLSDLEIAARIAIAALAGMAVGFEREWAGHASGPTARFGGIRTFFLLGAVAGIAGWLGASGREALGVALVVPTGLFVVGAYLVAMGRIEGDLDGTTEVAALAVLGIGVVAGLGHLAVAAGATAVSVLLLNEKATIRAFVAGVDRTEMRAALHFAVLALVVLPILPAGPFGPYDAIRHRTIRGIVLLLSGLNFAGYLLRSALGSARGHLVTGALGGLVSSTAVTLAYARKSRVHPDHAAALAAGTVAATAVQLPRMVVLAAIFNATFAPTAALWVLPMALAAGALTAWLSGRARLEGPDDVAGPGGDNPLQLGAAIRMAVLFQAVLVAVELLQDRFGAGGVLAGSAVLGLTNVDALTLAVSRLAQDRGSSELAAAALVIGATANCLTKTGISLVFGSARYRWAVTVALLGIAASGVATWLVFR